MKEVGTNEISPCNVFICISRSERPGYDFNKIILCLTTSFNERFIKLLAWIFDHFITISTRLQRGVSQPVPIELTLFVNLYTNYGHKYIRK